MPEIEVNIEVYCAGCGAGLCNQTESTKTRNRGEPCFRVEVCECCLERKGAEEYEKGLADGRAEAKEEAGEEDDAD